MITKATPFDLPPYRVQFVHQFLMRPVPKSLLVAPVQSGKTTTALYAAKTVLERKLAEAILVLTNFKALQEQWQSIALRFGLEFQTSTEDFADVRDGLVTTPRSLQSASLQTSFDRAIGTKSWLIIVDDVHVGGPLSSLVDDVLARNPSSRALFISSNPSSSTSVDSQFRYDSESILQSSIVEKPESELVISRFSPSFGLLRTLQKGHIDLDSLTWREFEKLIAKLLEADGYEVKLMQGSKDGGVDVIATKDLGVSGSFRALWQAKKKGLTQRVGISVIRELADTRREFGASKGVIVTSTYLTRGALERVDRDKFLLAKVDRDDLDSWAKRAFHT